MLRRFQSEAEKTGMLMHPNIVIVYHLGSRDGYPYIVMEYIEGEPLDRLIKTNHPLPLLYKLKIIEQVCCALSYAHERDMVHRDVKPANVIVQPDGNAKLLDFGIARQEKLDRDLGLTLPGNIIGTVPYMAPERLKGAPLDGRSDIFAAGVMLYQFLTGRLPFDGDEMALVQKLLNDQHPPLSSYIQDYPAQVDIILDRALAKDPDQRYATAEEMGADLAAVILTLTTGQVSAMLVEAQSEISVQSYTAARKLLKQVIKLEGKNKEARALLSEVEELLARRQRSEQAESCQTRARQAIDKREFDSAIGLLEQAERLAPGDPAVAALREQARAGKRLVDQVDGYLRQADAARASGNFTAARGIVEKALELDKSNSRLRSAYNDLLRQAEESVREAKMKSLIEAARAKLNLQQFGEVAALLKDAEEIDPLHVDLVTLRAAVDAGLREEQCRRIVEEVERQIQGVAFAAAAERSEAAQRAETALARALAKMPYDSGLLRLQVEFQRQQREHGERAQVEDTVRECRAQLDAGQPDDALAIVRRTLDTLPGNDQLVRLEASIEAHLSGLAREQRRANYLADARDAMSRNDYTAAIPILIACQGEGQSEDTARMLEFAREELHKQRCNDLFARYATQAQALLREGQYHAVIHLLEDALFEQDEPRLRAFLERARTLQLETQIKSDEAQEKLRTITAVEDYERALDFIDSLPEALRQQPSFTAARLAIERDADNEWTQLQLIGQAYAVKAATNKALPRQSRSQTLRSQHSILLTHMFKFLHR